MTCFGKLYLASLIMNARMDFVITVDEHDVAIGKEEKLKAHENGTLHRAFSVFIFNDKGEMLLQQRAWSKYHSGGLWTNACCSHPMPGEDNITAARRRLQEEMGFDCELTYLKPFRYRAEMNNGLIENEYDHLFKGEFSGVIQPNPDEVVDYKYLAVPEIKAWVDESPESFTEWFKMILPQFL